jgi:hypothetical protein
MHLRSTTRAIEHGVGALSEGLLILAIAAALILATAFIGRTNPAGAGLARAGSTTGSWIALTQVNGKSASIQPSLGSTVSFATSYPRTVKNPRIEVLCYEDGNLVFGMAGSVTYEFLLGGAGSIWLTIGGGADCTANLFYFGSHAGKQTYNKLATTSFAAGG